jgi:ABC-type spermidine/putrescine transport system permease subunit II
VRFSALYRALILLIAIFLVAPIVVVVSASLSSSGTFEFPPSGLSLQWFDAFFASESFTHAFLVSLTVATIVSVLAAFVGALAAIGLVRFAPRRLAFLETVFLAPVVVPGVLLGAALLLFYLHSAIRGTLLALLIGHLVIAIPYALQTMIAGLAGLGIVLEEAAMSLGATPLQAFNKVTLPLIRSSVVAAAVLSFVISFSDVNLAIFLTGPTTVTLPMVIFTDVLHLGEPTVAAASTIQVLLIAVLLVVAQRWIRLRISQR